MRIVVLVFIALAACGDDPASTVDAGIDAPPTTPWPSEIQMVRAAPVGKTALELYAAHGAQWFHSTDGLYRSTDDFVTWTRFSNDNVGAVAFGDGTSVYVGFKVGLTYLLDRYDGTTPTRLAIPGPPTELRLAAAGTTVYALTNGPALYKSTDRGAMFVADTLPSVASTWKPTACGDDLALASLVNGVSYVRHASGVWDPIVGEQVDSVVCGPSGGFVISTHDVSSVNRVRRISWPNDVRTDAVTTMAFPVYLAAGQGSRIVASSLGVVSPPSLIGAHLYESTDGGATFVERTVGAPNLVHHPEIIVGATGIIGRDGYRPVLLPTGGTAWKVIGLPGGFDGRALDISFQGSRYVLATYQSSTVGNSDEIFVSEDRGRTWAYGSRSKVGIRCLAVWDQGIFLGGEGDVRGAAWEAKDPTGVRTIAEGRVDIPEDAEGSTWPIVACTWQGIGQYSTVWAAQTIEGTQPGTRVRILDVFREIPAWRTLAPITPLFHRVTAIEPLRDPGTSYLKVSFERLAAFAAGYETSAWRATYDMTMSTWDEPNREIKVDLIGAHGAQSFDNVVFVFPGNMLIIAEGSPVLHGIEGSVAYNSAHLDSEYVLWLSTSGGLYRSVGPIIDVSQSR